MSNLSERKMLPAALGLILVVGIPAIGYCQQSLVGRYVGQVTIESAFPTNKPRPPMHVELIIASVEDDVIKGSGKSNSPSCKGVERSIVGKQTGDKIEVKAADPKDGCEMVWSLAVSGTKLTGTTVSGYRMELSKQ